MTEPNEDQQVLRDDSDLSEHHVAMVVFTTVRAVDDGDAAFIARVAIVDAFTDTRVIRPHRPVTLMARLRDDQVLVEVSEVADLRSVGLSGYVQIQPSNRAYPREEDR